MGLFAPQISSHSSKPFPRHRHWKLAGKNDRQKRHFFLDHPLVQSEKVRPGQAVKTKEFWLLWLAFFLNFQAQSYYGLIWKVFGQTFIHDDQFLAIVGALGAVFASLGVIFWGRFIDFFSYRFSMVNI